jgi:hypothetical protein
MAKVHKGDPTPQPTSFPIPDTLGVAGVTTEVTTHPVDAGSQQFLPRGYTGGVQDSSFVLLGRWGQCCREVILGQAISSQK